jgi:hypothetical protein
MRMVFILPPVSVYPLGQTCQQEEDLNLRG